MLPVLLVHGIWDTGDKLAPMARTLEAAGAPRAHAMTLSKNDGSVPLVELAAEVAAAAEALGPRIDLVGFSMGALVSRTYLQRLGGRARVRRFVSISGPHAGTRAAHLARSSLAGVRDMRPGSELLCSLAQDPDPWGEVEVHTMWTSLDLMILPPRSSVLPGARSDRAIPVALHRWIVTDRRALDHVVALLSAP